MCSVLRPYEATCNGSCQVGDCTSVTINTRNTMSNSYLTRHDNTHSKLRPSYVETEETIEF